MAAFEDNQGRAWDFEIDFPGLRRIKRKLGVDLVALSVAESFDRLAEPVFLIDCLYCLCEPEVREAGLTDEDFGKRCVIDLEPVVGQIMEGLAGFFRRLGKSQQAELLMKTWTMTILSGRVLNELPGRESEMMDLLTQRIQQAIESGELFTETPPTQVESALSSPA